MESHDLDLEFWQKVKEDYINSPHNYCLCSSSKLFDAAWDSGIPSITFDAAYFSLNIDEDIKYGCGYVIVGIEGFLFSFEKRASFETERQIRLDFLDYMIEKERLKSTI